MNTNNTNTPRDKGEKRILYKELSYEIVGSCFGTQNELGRYAREKQYGDLLEKKLKERGLSYEREKFISKTGVDANRADFIVENTIIVEIKAKPFLTREDYYQLLRYLGERLVPEPGWRGRHPAGQGIVRQCPRTRL